MDRRPVPYFDRRRAAGSDDLHKVPTPLQLLQLGLDEVTAGIAVESRIRRRKADNAHKKTKRPVTSRVPAVMVARTSARNLFDDARPLAATTSGFRLLLTALDRRLHVVTAALQLAENAFRRHLSLQVLDRTLDATIANDDLEGLAGNGFSRLDNLRHGQCVLSRARDYDRPRSDVQAPGHLGLLN